MNSYYAIHVLAAERRETLLAERQAGRPARQARQGARYHRAPDVPRSLLRWTWRLRRQAMARPAGVRG